MENKKSFLIYCDLIHTVNKMPDDKAGLLFKHLLAYVNDLNPITDDLIVELTFEPIKQQLKRDLKTWNESKEIKSLAGIMGNLKRWHPDLHQKVIDNELSMNEAKVIADNRKVSHTDVLQSQTIAKIAVTVTDTVNVTDTVTVNVNEKGINKKRLLDISSSEVKNENYLQIAKAFHELFRNNILEANGSTTKIDNAKGEWIEDIRKLIEIDNQSKENLIAVFNFLKKDAFWKSNIQSTSKLREKFDTLLVKANSENKQKNKNGATTDELKELFVKHFK